MSDKLKGYLSGALGIAWWIANGLWKDSFFAWLKPLLPGWLVHPPTLDLLYTFGPPIMLVAVAGYFVWPSRAEPLRIILVAINDEGVKLLNEGNLATDIVAWTFKFSDWHRRILDAAEAYSPELRNHLEPIKRFTVPDEPVAVDDHSHRVNVKIVAEVMHRVDVWLRDKAKR